MHKPGSVFLSRVDEDRISTDREACEWFTGLDAKGQPTWGALAEKKPVFENPAGTGWCLSASYNPGLRRYLLSVADSVQSFFHGRHGFRAKSKQPK